MGTPGMQTRTVTFLFSDIEGSTQLLQRLEDGYVDVLQQHHRLFREVIRETGGQEIGTEGDSFFVVFADPRDAVEAAARIQRSLASHPFPEPVRVRMGLHTGQGRVVGESYVGIDVNRAARIAAAGHGGQVLLSDATRAMVEPDLPEDLTVRDLGPHRLKDLAHPEHLHQLVMRGLPSDFPPPRSLDARPNNLPLQLTRFIGRRDQVSQIKARLTNGTRLLTLTGPGGTGKTRLALEVAAETLTAFEDGVWFVELAPIADPAVVVSTIAETLGVKERPGGSLEDALESALKDRAILVVLDNFEQVLEAGAAVERLLLRAPRLRVLVTSRAVLHRYGEQEFPVPPLHLPDPGDLPDLASLSAFEAIDLFIERAMAVKPDFALTKDNAPSVAEITVRLDGLPLAIELAASRVKILSPQAIAERLARGTPLLISGASDAPARQRTLRGAIEWSYDLLQPSERELFEQLSVFQGGGSLEAIEWVCPPAPGIDTLEGVASLVDHSLLRQVETEQGEPRFVMLETIRQYAAERLDERPEAAAAARRAHAAYFAHFALGLWRDLTGPGRERALSAMAADIENLRTAWRSWRAEGDLDELNKLVDSLWVLFDARGWYHSTVDMTTDLLNVLSSRPSTPERAMQEGLIRTSLARALMAINGYTQEAEDSYMRALELFEGQGEPPHLFPVLRGLASFHVYRAEFQKSERVARQILDLAEAQDDPGMRIDGLFVLGTSLLMQEDFQGGLRNFDEAIRQFESGGYQTRPMALGNNPAVASFTTSALAMWQLAYPDQALERANRAVALATELDHPFTLAYGFFHAGLLHLWRGELELVRDRASRLVDVADRHDLQIWRAVGRCLLGAAQVGMGSPEEGLALMRQGLGLYQGLKTPPLFWPLLLSLLAAGYGGAGKPSDALGFVEEAIAMVGGGRVNLPELYLLKGDLLLALQETGGESAEDLFRGACEIAHDLGTRMTELRGAVRLRRLWMARGEGERGREELQAIYDTFTEGFETVDLMEARALLEGLQ